MIQPTELDLIVHQERFKERIHNAEKARLIASLKPKKQSDLDVYHRLVARLGSQMVKLGGKLETYGSAPSRKPI